MQILIEYIYYYLYELARKLKSSDSNESATLYISWILAGIIVPPFMFLIYKLFGKNHKIIFLISALIVGVIIHYFNMKIIKKRINIDELMNTYKHKSQLQVIIGYIIVILLLCLAPIFGFYFLSI